MLSKIKWVTVIVLFSFFTVLGLNNIVHADEAATIVKIESPNNLSSTGGDVNITGFAVSKNNIAKINIYVDGALVGPLTSIGLTRTDIQSQYPTYPNSVNSGFSYKLNTRGYSDGNHEIKIGVLDNTNLETSSTINLSLTNQRTSIIGQAQASKEQMIAYLQQNNSAKDFIYINNFISILIDEANIEGVRSDIAFAQMMKETNYLKFTGTVQENQNNFAGLGATGGSTAGASFPDIRTGIRAVIQHLKAYATTSPLVQAVVDPRFKYVTRGSAPYAEWLGINENPNGYGWATDFNYGYDIVNRINIIKAIGSNITKAIITNFNVNGEYYSGKSLTVSSSGLSPNKMLYRFWVGDLSTGQWTIIQDYSEVNTCTWTPEKVGKYELVVHVKDQLSTSNYDSYAYKDITVGEARATISSFNTDSQFWTNKSVNSTSSGTSTNSILYQFWVGNLATGQWSIIQDYSTSNSFSWTPLNSGKYELVVHVKDQYSSKNFDDYAFKDIVVNDANAKINSFNLGSDNFSTNNSISETASGTSSTKILYRFWVGDLSTGQWAIVQDYSEKNGYLWTPSKPGRYELVVHAKDQYSNKNYDDYLYKDILVINEPKSSVVSFDPGTEFYQNKNTIGSSTGTASNNILYSFWVGDRQTGKWTIIQDYSEKSTYSWTPTNPGNYELVVHTKDQYSKNSYDDYAYKDIVVKESIAKLSSFNMDNYLWVNKSTTISANGTASNGALYSFWIGDRTDNTWKLAQDYSTNNTFTWTPDKSGNFELVVHIKDSKNDNVYDDYAYKDVMVNESKAVVTSFNLDTNFVVGKNSAGSANANAPYKALYEFWVGDLDLGKWTNIQSYSENNTFSWKPEKQGRYELVVHIRDINNNVAYDDYAYSDIYAKAYGISSKVIVVDAGHNYGGDDGAYAKYPDITYSERDLNMQMALKVKAELENLGATVILTRQQDDLSTDTVQSSLQKRVDIANNASADLFISLHHDTSGNSSTTGISTHYSTYKPGIDQSGVVTGNDPNGWYSGVNIDSTPSAAAVISRDLATLLADGLSSGLGYTNLKAHDHNLFVTVNANMPAVLIEEGFISNLTEAQRCADTYQQTLKAQKIAQIINNYYSI